MSAKELEDKLHDTIASLWKMRDDIRLLPIGDFDYEVDLAQRRISSAARKLTKAAREVSFLRIGMSR